MNPYLFSPLNQYSHFPLAFFGTMVPFFVAFVMIDAILKAYALWKAGRHNQPYWFVAIVLFNTLGILPAIYLLFFQSKTSTTSAPKTVKTKSKRK